MHDGMPYVRNQGQGQGHSREVDRQSPMGLIFLLLYYSEYQYVITDLNKTSNNMAYKCLSLLFISKYFKFQVGIFSFYWTKNILFTAIWVQLFSNYSLNNTVNSFHFMLAVN